MKPLYDKYGKARHCLLGQETVPTCSYRSDFYKDYARLVHSPSFRKLQDKTQLFPTFESDFFRSRLTHSLEVAQIAKSIARHLNKSEESFEKDNIDEDLVSFAALAHDLGHPPFGHCGEAIMNERMKEYGGFEANAQTLRILAKLERKYKPEQGDKESCGLNLTYRSLASILKYDKEINRDTLKEKTVLKGYYETEKELVRKIKIAILGETSQKKLKVIECQIMDLADDIAYSTYDLEDAIKVGFISALDFIFVSDETADSIAKKIRKDCDICIEKEDVDEQLSKFFDFMRDNFKEDSRREEKEIIKEAYSFSKDLSQKDEDRTALTSRLVGKFVEAVKVEPNQDNLALSKVYFDSEIKKEIEILKRFVYETVVKSSRVQLAEYRAERIIGKIFDALPPTDECQLLPDDFKCIYREEKDETKRMRIICDFIAGMTDRYAIEFYGRLTSENPQTIFKPI